MNPSVFLPAIGKLLDRLGCFSLDLKTRLGEGKLLRIALVFHPARGGEVG